MESKCCHYDCWDLASDHRTEGGLARVKTTKEQVGLSAQSQWNYNSQNVQPLTTSKVRDYLYTPNLTTTFHYCPSVILGGPEITAGVFGNFSCFFWVM